jgi:alcohol dehydrogenase
MRAAVLHEFGKPLTVETLADPAAGPGEVVVDVVAAGILPYANEVFDGTRRYLLELPVVPGPGAIGRVRSTGPDATHLVPGDWVTCDPTIRSRDGAPAPDITLQGWSARGQGGLRLQRRYGHGSYAEQLLAPAENVFPIGPIETADAGRWCALGLCLVPYGGLLAGELRAGETVLISGATGNYGSIAVAVALAMGAGCVVAPGRNADLLTGLERRFGTRVRPVRLTGERSDTDAMRAAAPGPIDLVLDLLPPAAGAAAVRAAAVTVREFGRVVLMGGVRDDLALPYPWLMRSGITVRGQWMYPPAANVDLIKLVRSGRLDLGAFEVTEFGLADVGAAVDHAAAHPRGFQLTALRPS